MVLPLHSWSLVPFQAFLLILMRVAPILFMMPVFSARNLPNLLKVGLTLTVSLVLWTVVKVPSASFPTDPASFGVFLILELLVGFFMALSVRLIFAGVELAGEIAGYQMGLSMANVIDPQSGVQTALLSQFHYLVAMLIYLSLDGHHWFFRALLQSFQVFSPGAFVLKEGLCRHFLHLSGNLFVIAVKLVAPVMAILLLIQIAMGILARTVPQVNILVSSFPLTIGLGLVFFGLSLELLWPYLKGLFEESGRGLLSTLLPLMRP